MTTFTTSAAPRSRVATSRTASNACWRRMSWWCALSLLLPASCRTTPPPISLELVHRSQPLLGTFVTISVYAASRDPAHSAINAAFDEFRRVDDLMSIHRADSELSRLNSRAARSEEHTSELQSRLHLVCRLL